MTLRLATLNATGLRDPSKCGYLLGDLSNLRWLFLQSRRLTSIFPADCRVLEDDYVVLSTCSSRNSVAVFLIIWCSLNADVNLVLAGDSDRLRVADVAVKSFELLVVAVYAPNIAAEKVSFNQRLALFLDDPKWIVLMGDWNPMLDPKIDWVGKGTSRWGRCESSLIYFMAHHDLLDRFCLDHQGKEMWTLL